MPSFSYNVFAKNIVEALENNAVGYSFAIYDAQELMFSGGGGWAVLNEVKHSANQRQATMSMTKTITAAAVLRAIEIEQSRQRNAGVAEKDLVTIDTPIEEYIPFNWVRGPHVRQITIRDLLQHTSGLRPATNDPDSYAGLMATIEAGAKDADFHKAFYANANFCLFRVFIPLMVAPHGTFLKSLHDGTIDVATADYYQSFVSQHVLMPAGVSGAVLTRPSGPEPFTRYYDFSNTSSYVVDPTDQSGTLRAGAGYWFMSAKEYGLFIAALQAGKIISLPSYQLMINALPADPDPIQQAGDRLGMWRQQSIHGDIFDHNGGFINSEADWMSFGNGAKAVIMLNSHNRSGKAPQDVVRDAFNDAWVTN